jgi:hypothetical protein
LSKWGWSVLKSEFMWVWLPASILTAVSITIRKVIVRFL